MCCVCVCVCVCSLSLLSLSLSSLSLFVVFVLSLFLPFFLVFTGEACAVFGGGGKVKRDIPACLSIPLSLSLSLTLSHTLSHTHSLSLSQHIHTHTQTSFSPGSDSARQGHHGLPDLQLCFLFPSLSFSLLLSLRPLSPSSLSICLSISIIVSLFLSLSHLSIVFALFFL